MFTRQAQQLNNNLWQGGLSPAQADAIANLLGQCRAPIEHRGPIQIDYTIPDMKLITPEVGDVVLPEIQLQPPEILPPRPPSPTFQPPETPEPYTPDPLPPPRPQFAGTGNNPGNFFPTYYGGSIGNRLAIPRWLQQLLRDAGKAWRIFTGDTDRRLDAIENLTPQDIVDALSDELHDWLEEDTGEDSDFGDNITVVTGITLSGNKLSVATRTVKVVGAFATGDQDIDVIECS